MTTIGQLGIGVASNSAVPSTTLTSITSGATAIAASFYHTCAIVSEGLQCWGQNEFAPVNQSNWQQRTSPVEIPTN